MTNLSLLDTKECAEKGIDIIYSKLLGLYIEIEYNTALRSIRFLNPCENHIEKKIKYGRTITYSQLAEKIGCRGARAVGNALGKNPLAIIIPCHRVVAKNGLGGYSAGIDIKTRLLELEKINVNNL